MSYLNFQIFKETSREKQTCLKENKWLSDQQPLFVILYNELMCLKKTYHSGWRCSEKTPEPIFGTMLAYDSMAGENKSSYLPYTYLVGGQLCTYISLSHYIHLWDLIILSLPCWQAVDEKAESHSQGLVSPSELHHAKLLGISPCPALTVTLSPSPAFLWAPVFMPLHSLRPWVKYSL